jgi:hypothetical protein
MPPPNVFNINGTNVFGIKLIISKPKKVAGKGNGGVGAATYRSCWCRHLN